MGQTGRTHWEQQCQHATSGHSKGSTLLKAGRWASGGWGQEAHWRLGTDLLRNVQRSTILFQETSSYSTLYSITKIHKTLLVAEESTTYLRTVRETWVVCGVYGIPRPGKMAWMLTFPSPLLPSAGAMRLQTVLSQCLAGYPQAAPPPVKLSNIVLSCTIIWFQLLLFLVWSLKINSGASKATNNDAHNMVQSSVSVSLNSGFRKVTYNEFTVFLLGFTSILVSTILA